MSLATPIECGTEYFTLEPRGDVAIIVPSPEVENLSDALIDQAAQLVLAPLKERPPTGLIVDMSGVNFVGSLFISFLLRCHMLIKKQGGEMFLAGVSDRVRELLRLTALDTLWALYDTRAEAIAALAESD